MSCLCSVHAKISCMCAVLTLLVAVAVPGYSTECSQWARLALLCSLLITASICDFAQRRIPNQITYSTLLCTAALMLITACFIDPLPDRVTPMDASLGCLLCGGVTFIGFYYRRIGGGDVKMASALGGLMGPLPALSAFLVAHLFAAMLILCALLILHILQQLQPALATIPPGKLPISKLLNYTNATRVGYSTKIPMAGFYSLGALAVLLADLFAN